MSGTERSVGKSGVRVPALGVGTNRWSAGEPGQARLNETLAGGAVSAGSRTRQGPAARPRDALRRDAHRASRFTRLDQSERHDPGR